MAISLASRAGSSTAPAPRDHEGRIQLGERLEREPALVQARVRHVRPGSSSDSSP